LASGSPGVIGTLNLLRDFFELDFITRAVAVGLPVSVCAALLGVPLVLKRFSMIGDGLSHVGFGSLCVALVMNASPLRVSVPVVMLAAFFLLRLSESGKIKGDAAIAVISSSSLAIGVLVVSLSGGMNMDVYSYLFGSVLAMSRGDVRLGLALSAAVLFLFAFFYHKIFAVTFDESFAKASGTKAGVYNTLLALLTAVTIVVGMRIMGAMLISSLIIFPALTSMRVCRSFRSVVITSAIVSAVCFFIGLLISFEFSTPAGASVVAVNLLVFLLFTAAGKIKRKAL